MPARRGGDAAELRVANVHQCLFAQPIGIALASLGKGDDFFGDDRDDGVRPMATAQGRSLIVGIKQQTCSAARFTAGRVSFGSLVTIKGWPNHLRLREIESTLPNNQGTASKPPRYQLPTGTQRRPLPL